MSNYGGYFMDKRYLIIIFIIFFCGIDLFFVANNSEMVGKASVDFDNYTFSVPRDYSLMNTFDTFVQIYNPNLGYLAFGYNDSANYTQSLEIINNKSNQKILSNGTINVDNITIYSIYFESIDDSNVSTNRSYFFFNKYGHSFKISMVGFNYDDDRNKTIDVIGEIVGSLRHNKKV